MSLTLAIKCYKIVLGEKAFRNIWVLFIMQKVRWHYGQEDDREAKEILR